MEVAEAIAAAVPASRAEQADSCGCTIVVVDAAHVVEVLTYLRDEPEHGYDMLVDLTAADHRALDGTIHVVYLLSSLAHNRRLIVKAKVAGDQPRIASAAGLWRSANWAEREVWDMFGVRFEGHPDLRRILMYEEFEGHPLRKDYPVDKRQPLVEERDPIANPWPSRDRY